MLISTNTYGLPQLPDLLLIQPQRAASRTRVFPMLFRLYDRRDDRPCIEHGAPVEITGTDIEAARAQLLHNRDPARFDVRVDTPAIPH